jgi:glutamine synthetase
LHAVAGLLAAMPETMLAFAPNYNSFRRFRPDAHAPVSASWGIDDRSAAVRVIVGDAKATRIEHRISGADVNPHVAMAAMLGAMLQGIEEGVMPPPRKTRCIRAKAHRCRWNGARRGRLCRLGARGGDVRRAVLRDLSSPASSRTARVPAQIDRFEYDTYLGLL